MDVGQGFFFPSIDLKLAISSSKISLYLKPGPFYEDKFCSQVMILFLQEGLTDDDYDMFYEIWQQFDPNGTQYIKYGQLSDFLDVLESPLQIHKPNKYKIISMDIPICRGDFCYCVDVLDALTKDFFARKGNPVEETAELGEVTAQADRPGYDPISSTLWRQREEYCARMIQTVWRRNFRTSSEEGSPPSVFTLADPLLLLARGHSATYHSSQSDAAHL